MTGLFRILLFILLGYILVKTFRFIISVFTSVHSKREDDRVKETTAKGSKINKKDVIEAEFEEIDESKSSTSNKKE